MAKTMEKSKQVHRLADTTYRNIEDMLKDLGNLAASAKIYHKAMQNMMEAAESFYSVVGAVGNKASNLPGGVRKLGESLSEVATSQKATTPHCISWLGSIMSDFILPLDLKVTNESKRYINMHKNYRHDCSKKEHEIAKINDHLKDYHKREKKEGSGAKAAAKEKHNLSRLAEESAELDALRTEGLRKALIEEQKLYSFVLEHLTQTIHQQVFYYSQSHDILTAKLVDWNAASKAPSDLPAESSILLVDPMSPRAFVRTSVSDPETMITNDPTLARSSVPFMATLPAAPERKPTLPEMTVDTTEVYGFEGHLEKEVSHLVKTDKECKVRAHFAFKADSSTQMSFNEGDIIIAFGDPKDGWQYGKNTRTKKSGWFPSDYVSLAKRKSSTDLTRRQSLETPPQFRPTTPDSQWSNEMDPNLHPAVRRASERRDRGRHSSNESSPSSVENMMNPNQIVSPPSKGGAYGTQCPPASHLPTPLTAPPTETSPRMLTNGGKDLPHKHSTLEV